MFATAICFHLSLICKVRSLPLEWVPSIRGSTLIGSFLARKYYTRLQVNSSGKHSSLLRYGNDYSRKKFYGRVHSNPEYKTFKGRNYFRTLVSMHTCHFHPSLIFAGKIRSLPLRDSKGLYCHRLVCLSL